MIASGTARCNLTDADHSPIGGHNLIDQAGATAAARLGVLVHTYCSISPHLVNEGAAAHQTVDLPASESDKVRRYRLIRAVGAAPLIKWQCFRHYLPATDTPTFVALLLLEKYSELGVNKQSART